MSKQRYLCIEGKNIPVSEEIYQVYYQFARKERYFSEDLKREKLLYDTEQQIAVLLPSREDSYERLLEQDRQFSDPNAATPEDDAVKADLLDRLAQALHTLSDDERNIIRELFYLEKTERDASASLHMPLSTFHSRKNAVLKKLRESIEKFPNKSPFQRLTK